MSVEIGYPKDPGKEALSTEQPHPGLVAGRIGIWEYALRENHATRSGKEQPAGAPGRLPGEAANPGAESGPLLVSAELEALLGLGRGQFDGQLASVLDRVNPTDRPVLLKAFNKAIRYGTSAEVEIRLAGTSQTAGWLLVRGAVKGKDGEVARKLVGVAVEITAQKSSELRAVEARVQAERRLAAQTRQLRCANEELESFCYSVSHDLRAPLRSIRGFNEVLLERYTAGLEPRAQDFLRRACESSELMDRLIEDLLKLSRVGRAEIVRRPLDLGKLAMPIIETLRASAPDRQVDFRVGPGLQAVGDPGLLRLALENLLGNAWKFTSQQGRAQIELGAVAAPRRAYFVRDNGAGFDPAHKSRLFGVFQRLHSESEFPGKGIGLALVQRVIHRHNGEVWAEGALGSGATFYFSLPDDELT